ncbi:MAG: DinB family protein [Acidobacteria bacterium]|nr:DinB family protein [Acidobacteriota bacterium]
MRQMEQLAELVERVVEGDPWHGSNVLALLDGVSARDAAAHVVPGAHSIWELVLHMTGWTREVQARLAGQAAGDPAAGDWPAVRDASPAAWSRAVAALVDSHRALAAALRASDDALLATPVVDRRDPAAGTGLSHYLTLHGLVHHTTYHAGQIALLRRAIEARVS